LRGTPSSDNGIRIWLNGKEVLSTKKYRAAAIDQDIVPVSMRRGSNEILVKVCSGGDWGFYLRITDAEGKPFGNLEYVPAARALRKRE